VVQVTYSIGLSLDADAERLYVARRRYTQVDVYNSNNGNLQPSMHCRFGYCAGTYLETYGPHSDVLWSDMIVRTNNVYVIDYIDTSVKQYLF
jgi:hypothetical protein